MWYRVRTRCFPFDCSYSVIICWSVSTNKRALCLNPHYTKQGASDLGRLQLTLVWEHGYVKCLAPKDC